MPRQIFLPLFAFVVLPSVLPESSLAQDGPRPHVAVYLDCGTFGCDPDFFRSEILFVDWVLDREAADVHLLVTSETSGGGGRQFTIDFLGQARFTGDDLRLTHSSSGEATRDDIRTVLSERFKAGLTRYAVYTSALDHLRVSFDADSSDASNALRDEHDPWDFWTISLGLNGNGSGQETFSSLFISSHVTASRTTDTWKIALGGQYNRNSSRQELSDRDVVATRSNWGVNGVLVRTLADHWSAGFRVTSSSNSAENQDIAVTVGPGIEFNIFPYDESTRRSLTLQYLVSANHFDWTETTVFDQLTETHPGHSLTANLQLSQPWGRVRLNLGSTQFLHDPGKYNVQIGGNFNWRIYRGLSLNGGGNYARVRDQLFLPKGALSDDEILTQQQELATGFRYFTFFGLSYRFGSVNNNVVNPRFGPDLRNGTFFFGN